MSRRRLRPEDVISALYEGDGFYEVGRGEDSESGYIHRLILSDGRREIVVNILGEEAFTARGAIQDALLQAEKLKGKFNGVVLAVPRKYQKAMDEGVLTLHGLGLAIYDNLGAEEVIPPKIRESVQEKKVEGQKAGEGKHLKDEELIQLKREFLRMLKVLEEIEARLDRLEREQNRLVVKMGEIERRLESTMYEKVEEVKAAPMATSNGGEKSRIRKNLPSYLVDNPWIDILSSRGEK